MRPGEGKRCRFDRGGGRGLAGMCQDLLMARLSRPCDSSIQGRTFSRTFLALLASSPSAASAPATILREVFGYDAFRGQQQGVIDHTIAGGDALVLMPTGGGKSLCYQVPAIARQRAGLGVTLVMATLNVFFRDTRFLWSVISLLWTYATPIFYPDTIWPEGLRGIFHLNPMYQLIDFLRQIVIAGIPPTPERLLACGAGAFGMLMIGLVIFRRYEEKFVFHL